jgi:hypothetical protein
VRQPATASAAVSVGSPTCITQPRNHGPSGSRATCGAYRDRPSSTAVQWRGVKTGEPSLDVVSEPTAAMVPSSWLSCQIDSISTQEPSTSTSWGHSQISATAPSRSTGSE